MNEYLLGGGVEFIFPVYMYDVLSQKMFMYVLQIKYMIALNQGQEFPAGVESKIPKFLVKLVLYHWAHMAMHTSKLTF